MVALPTLKTVMSISPLRPMVAHLLRIRNAGSDDAQLRRGVSRDTRPDACPGSATSRTGCRSGPCYLRADGQRWARPLINILHCSRNPHAPANRAYSTADQAQHGVVRAVAVVHRNRHVAG